MNTCQKKRKKIRNLLAFVMLIVLVNSLLEGCTLIKRNRYLTSCIVNNIDEGVSSSIYVCSNDSDQYVYDNNSIYCYADSTRKVEVASPIRFMACNNDYLYYYCRIGTLYRVYLPDLSSELVSEDKSVISMKACGDDVFMMFKENEKKKDIEEEAAISQTQEGEDDIAASEQYQGNMLYCYHGSEDGVSVDESICQLSAEELAKKKTWIAYGEYEVAVDYEKHIETPQIVIVKNEKFQFTCYDNFSIAEGDELVSFSCNTYTYQGNERRVKEIEEVEDYGGGIYAPNIYLADRAYVLVQYGKAYQGYGRNQRKDFKQMDGLFTLDFATGRCEKYYASEKGVQIAGYSVKNRRLYLLKPDGVYGCEFNGANGQLLWEKDKDYDSLAFEYCEGKLFIYEEGDVVKLLKVVS